MAKINKYWGMVALGAATAAVAGAVAAAFAKRHALEEAADLEDDFEDEITLVTTLDAKPEEMLISIDSDLGKALAGKKAGDIVTVNAPGDNYEVKILEIL